VTAYSGIKPGIKDQTNSLKHWNWSFRGGLSFPYETF
jgi:hypothetical protein